MSARFDIAATALPGLNVLTRTHIGDSRGWFERIFCVEELQEVLGKRSVVQINRTLTLQRGSVRGMHFQHAPSAEMKFVSCLHGEVFDVAVDLRPESATFLQWHAELLSAHNRKTLAIPEGFAHGFQTLTDNCEMFYLHTAAYNPSAEDGLSPKDPALAIAWPLPLTELSARDAGHPMIAAGFRGVRL
ncbi:dTDP-4-dehydrorhamnose 3,5-epimerase family protein [Pusillimonas minor]|uniref:dTDP-4-dehydrorhamnose 3,5-epimerase n=1 Tax=Pusillimonas minor TaxID=2697024 RepID=A0A842HUX0_9BURK|nr:dTDP-4-dehydrorhamnose 3,5-epimerase family protein [Pusillimonas minor]MBC2770595.1 dTDP-4-dehydrorhamnose 3,5-epimerase family protein [Pusillimonas minor]